MKYTAAITIAALATSVSAANPWSDWSSSSSSSSSTTSSAGCGPTTGVSTKCATWTVHDKATSKCETVTTTAVPSDCTWGDWESTTTEKATTTSSAKDCGTTTSTSTGKVTYTKKEGEVVTKDITTVVTKTVECSATKDGEWDDAYITTTSSSDKCGPTTGVSTSTGCAKWTVTGKESSKCSTAYVTTTAVPSTCTTEDAAEETWGDWATADGYTTTVVTAITTYCAKPTTIVHAGKTYTVTGATTLTITDCPCTVSVPIYTKTSTSCSSAATDGAYDPSKSTVDAGNNGWGKSSAVDAGKASSTVDAGKGGAASYTKPAVATYTGGANALNMGAGLAGVGAIAAFFL